LVKWLEPPEINGLPSRIEINRFKGLHEFIKDTEYEGPHFEHADICARLMLLSEKPIKARVPSRIANLERLEEETKVMASLKRQALEERFSKQLLLLEANIANLETQRT